MAYDVAPLPRRAFERLSALEAANRIDEGGLDMSVSDSAVTPGEAGATGADARRQKTSCRGSSYWRASKKCSADFKRCEKRR